MSEDRWAQFTPREREIIRWGLSDVFETDDPDEDIQRNAREAEKLYDEIGDDEMPINGTLQGLFVQRGKI